MDPGSSTPISKSPWRWVALASWLLIALSYLAFFLADLRLDFNQLQQTCETESCNYLALTEPEEAVLESWGLSLRTYSLVINTSSIVTVSLFWLLGLLILWRQRNTRIGWAVSLALIILPISMIADVDNLIAINPALMLPSTVQSLVGFTVSVLFIFLFPSGRFYPGWAFIPFLLATLAFSVYVLDFNRMIQVPERVQQIIFLFFILLFLSACYFQVLRYRNISTRIERQQTKWIIYGMFFLTLGFVLFYLIFDDGMVISPGAPRLLASTGGWLFILFGSFTALPLTMTIAIMRYRLWDIDLVIRRTLQYSLLTSILVLVYFGCVVLLQTFISATGGQQSSAVIVISTLAIAALFNPLRLRIQAFIDRRFYRSKYDAEHALDQFALKARDEMDMDRLVDALVGLTRDTMQPDLISLWLLENSGNRQKIADLADL